MSSILVVTIAIIVVFFIIKLVRDDIQSSELHSAAVARRLQLEEQLRMQQLKKLEEEPVAYI